jgi:hypothetical protein
MLKNLREASKMAGVMAKGLIFNMPVPIMQSRIRHFIFYG